MFHSGRDCAACHALVPPSAYIRLQFSAIGKETFLFKDIWYEKDLVKILTITH